MTKRTTYLYMTKHHFFENEIFELEMKSLFNESVKNDVFISNKYIEPSTSVFIKYGINITHQSNQLQDLIDQIEKDVLHLDDYKIKYLKNEHTEYNVWLDAIKKIGTSIIGNFSLDNPKIIYALTKFNGMWYFGELLNNDKSWRNRKKKPYNYSYSLDIWLARTIINIGTKNDTRLKIIDPCCGVGTTLIEGRMMGYDIVGCELNTGVAENCNENLKYFNLKPDTINMDMTKIKSHYDLCIIDLPYGQFSTTTKEEQLNIIKKSKTLATKAVLIGKEDMTEWINDCGLEIKESCIIRKNNEFARYLYICY